MIKLPLVSGKRALNCSRNPLAPGIQPRDSGADFAGLSIVSLQSRPEQYAYPSIRSNTVHIYVAQSVTTTTATVALQEK